jgi:hypothetical protein
MTLCLERTILLSVQSSTGNAGLGANEPRAQATAAWKCQKWVAPRHTATRTAYPVELREVKAAERLAQISIKLSAVGSTLLQLFLYYYLLYGDAAADYRMT